MPREGPAPALGAAGCSVPARKAKGLWETPQSAISQTSQVSFLPRCQGRGTETAEGQQQQKKFPLSREGWVAPAGKLGHGGEATQVPWDGPDTGEANGFWLLCGVFK